MINSHKSKRIQKIAAVKKAVIATCARHGVFEVEDIRALAIKATSAIKQGTIPCLKSWHGHDLSVLDQVG